MEGQLGLEPTFPEFLANQLEVFRLAREVLADDGTAWVNMGDCYATAAGKVNTAPGGGTQGERWTGIRGDDKHPARGPITQPNRMPQDGFKPKDLVGQPWRLAFALQGHAVISGAELSQWADWLGQARASGDWEMVQMVEDRLRAESLLGKLRGQGWWLRSDIIWSKPNPMPESCKDRPTKSHEYLFLLAKSERYHFDFDAFQEPVTGNANPRVAGWMEGAGAHSTLVHNTPKASKTGVGFGRGYDAVQKPRVKNNTSFDAALVEVRATRNRRTVWTIPTQAYEGAHFATYPEKLVEPCILAGCPVGGTVLDIYFGSGTTGQVAQRLGRNWIGIELNQANRSLQDKRLQQPSLQLEAA